MKNFKYILIAALAAFCGLVFLKVHFSGREKSAASNAGPAEAYQMPNAQKSAPPAVPKIYGYMILRGDASAASMQANLSKVDGVIIESLHLAGGQISLDNPSKQKPAFSYIRAHSGAKIIALINNYSGGKWLIDQTAAALADPLQRGKLADSIDAYVLNNKLDGVSLDLEGLRGQQVQDLIAFSESLENVLHKNNLTLSINVESDPSLDYAGLAKNVDQLILMDYDEHSTSTDPGPVASLQWFRQNLQTVLAAGVDPQKITLGLGSYAYDWQDDGSSSGMTYGLAAQTAEQNKAGIILDKTSQNDYFSYEKGGVRHTVWMLDSASAGNEEKLGEGYGIENYAVYRFGSEDQNIWKTLK